MTTWYMVEIEPRKSVFNSKDKEQKLKNLAYVKGLE